MLRPPARMLHAGPRARIDRRAPRPEGGFTLVELLVVLVILATVALLVVPRVTETAGEAEQVTTRTSLLTLREAAVTRYTTDVGDAPRTSADLFRAPAGVPAWSVETRRGWRGPYVLTANGRYSLANEFQGRGFTADYGADGDPAVLDAWGNPIVLQIPDLDGDAVASAEELRHARFVSAGPDRKLTTPRSVAEAQPPGDARFPSRAQSDDDLVLYVRVADGRP